MAEAVISTDIQWLARYSAAVRVNVAVAFPLLSVTGAVGLNLKFNQPASLFTLKLTVTPVTGFPSVLCTTTVTLVVAASEEPCWVISASYRSNWTWIVGGALGDGDIDTSTV